MSGRLARRTLPRALVLASRADVRGRVARTARRRGRVELFFAFDDPCSAIALLDLAERLRDRDADLVLLPVVRRGIPGDPAVADKRRYAIADARRLGARTNLTLGRGEPLAPEQTADLAAWVAGARPDEAIERFCVAALWRLWLDDDGRAVPLDELAEAWRAVGLGEPAGSEDAVRRNERRMARRGPYDTPAAWVHGQWFFAHDRGPQIAVRLDALGFGARA